MMLEIEEDCGVFQLISRKEAPSSKPRPTNRKQLSPPTALGGASYTLTAQQTHGTQSMGF